MFKSSGLRPQVHPIDSGNLLPYSFSSAVSSLLQNAARALNLHCELSGKAFYSTFRSSSNTASNQSSKHDMHAEGSPPSTIITHPLQQVQHLICLYQKLPSCGSDTGIEDFSQVLFKTRPPSPGGRSSAHFVPAIDLWVTYISRPPIVGLVSIPPRLSMARAPQKCLSRLASHKLGIYGPSSVCLVLGTT